MISQLETITPIMLESYIFSIRGKQVMIDRDLAQIYQVEVKRLNEQVKRNIERFPESFRFKLTNNETLELVANCDRFKNLKHSTTTPHVFTEQGVSMLSAVLKSKTAIKVSIAIMDAFVQMRKLIGNHQQLFQLVTEFELHKLKTKENFEKVFKALETPEQKNKQGIFYNGQIHDAYHFVNELIRSAKISITIIDNYIDDSVLTMLSKRSKGVTATIYTAKITKQLQLDLDKYHQQYATIKINTFKQAHDRFVIVDNQVVYHLGASLKDLGKKWFAFSKMQMPASEILNKLGAKQYD